MSVSCLDSTDWVADFLSRDSYAVCSCAAVRKTSLLVLAVPWRQRPAQTQSMSEIYLKNMHAFTVYLSILPKINAVVFSGL